MNPPVNSDQQTGDFGPDNAGHDTDCDCKPCLLDAWEAEVEALHAQIGRCHAEIARAAKTRQNANVVIARVGVENRRLRDTLREISHFEWDTLEDVQAFANAALAPVEEPR